MLEYMMVRQVDAPIIQEIKSGKMVRWIVLDEAHTTLVLRPLSWLYSSVAS